MPEGDADEERAGVTIGQVLRSCGWIPPDLRSRGKNRHANVNQGEKATPASISGNACHANVNPGELTHTTIGHT